MELEWTYINDKLSSRVVSYRGHIITVRQDIDAVSPREGEYDWYFVSTDDKFATPDNNDYRPIEEFYIDIYRFATGQWGVMTDCTEEDIRDAYQYVEENLIVYPIGGICRSAGANLYVGNRPTLEDELDGKYNGLLGAVFISIETARKYYGADKSVDELYALAEPDVSGQLAQFAMWLEGDIEEIRVAPDEKISFLLSAGGDETCKIASDWEDRAENITDQVWGGCSNDDVELVECLEHIDETADWLISELKKLDCEQLKPTMKTNVIKLLKKGE